MRYDEDEDEDEDEELQLPYCNYTTRYGRGRAKEFDYLGEEEEPEDEEYLDKKGYRRAGRKKNRKNLGWAIIAFLEVLAITAIALWWMSWIF